MMRGFRRALLCTLFILVMIQLHVCAQSTSYAIEEMSIRINNPGAQIFTTIEGTPGEWVSIELVRPGEEIANAYDCEDLIEVFAGLDMLQIPDSGKLIYEYTAGEQTGIFTLRVRGAITSLSFEAEGNIPQKQESDVYYADFWTGSSYTADDPYTQNSVRLTEDLLNKGAEYAATNIKTKLDAREKGRKLLFIEAKVTNQLAAKSVNFIWEDEVVEEVAAQMEAFFKAFYEIGGEIDGIYSDDETTMCPWNLTSNGKITGEDLQNKLNGITADPKYQEYIRPQLAERGFRFDRSPTQNELTIVSYTRSESASNKEYMIWTAVMDTYKSECLRKAFYEPAKKYFPYITYANYWSNDTYAAYYTGNAHRYHLGGNRISAGTHSSPVLYQAQGESKFIPDGSDYKVPSTPFGETLWLVNSMRSVMLSTPGGKTMPWVNAKIDPTKNFASIKNDYQFYYEYINHIGMCNPDALLFYGPAYYPTDSAEMAKENALAIIAAMEELNAYTKKSDAKTLVTDCVPIDAPYILSGMYTDGRNLWRITPDTSIMSEGQSFCVNEGIPTFYIGGITITFPDGEILPNVHSTHGYWVETPAGTYPEISYDTPPAKSNVILKMYDKNGIVIGNDSDAKIDSVGLFVNNEDNGNTDDISMNIVKYNSNGFENIEPLNNLIEGGTWGGKVFYEFDNYGDSKLLIWESLGNLKPITPALPWNGR